MLCHTLLVSMLSLEMNISLKLHFVTIISLNSTNIRFKEIRTLVFHVCSFIVDCKCALVSRFLFFLLFNCVILKFLQFFSQFSSKTSWFYNLKTKKFKILSFFCWGNDKICPREKHCLLTCYYNVGDVLLFVY